jgi:quinol-cytochrome oxidoreductase complex cytochrome b subunit
MTPVSDGEMTRASAAVYLIALLGYWVCATVAVIHYAGTHPSSPRRIAPVGVVVFAVLAAAAVVLTAALNWQVVRRPQFGPVRITASWKAFVFVVVFSVWGALLPAAVRALRGRPADAPATRRIR